MSPFHRANMARSPRRMWHDLRLRARIHGKLTTHQRAEAVRRRDKGEETLAEIGRTYNVSPQTIGRV